MYSEIYLRLEPLGLERVAAAVRAAGHEVRLLDHSRPVTYAMRPPPAPGSPRPRPAQLYIHAPS